MDPAEVHMAKQLLLEKIAIFKIKHENKCTDGKSSSNETRMENLNEIQTLLDEIGCQTSLEQHMVNIMFTICCSNDVWHPITCKEVLDHWELWDKKEE